MSTPIEVEVIEEFPVYQYTDARRRKPQQHSATRWILAAGMAVLFLLFLGVSLVTYGLVASPQLLNDLASSGEKPVVNAGSKPDLTGFKEFRLGMTRAEIWKIVQGWERDELLVLRVFPPDQPPYLGIRGFELTFEDERGFKLTFEDGQNIALDPSPNNSRLVKLEVQFDKQERGTAQKFWDALERKHGTPKSRAISPDFVGVTNQMTWESADDDIRLRAAWAPSYDLFSPSSEHLGTFHLMFEHGAVSREQAVRQRTSDAIESLEIE